MISATKTCLEEQFDVLGKQPYTNWGSPEARSTAPDERELGKMLGWQGASACR